MRMKSFLIVLNQGRKIRIRIFALKQKHHAPTQKNKIKAKINSRMSRPPSLS
jgi:hypothetical protein